ncbi:hypothetical protein GCM10023213_38830 [Prosthecobacter algae]|uniref:PsbP C-terminal domain-containing protein n=1 Tax=Prosthecobacter algae TaxID=1144682 RepID=A0ABP9PMQ1_9BACT
MRSFLLLVTSLLAFTIPSLAETVDLGHYGQVKLAVPGGWGMQSQKVGDIGVNLTVRPKSDANAACKVTIAFTNQKEEVSAEEQQKRFEKMAAIFAQSSVEQKIEVQKIRLKSGVGFYACFTDPNLVGKPPEPRNYKVLAPAMIVLSKDVLISVTLFTDDKTSQEFTDLVKMLESVVLVNTL